MLAASFKIDRIYKRTCLPMVMDRTVGLNDQPEIATNEDWRSLMRRTRQGLGLTQSELGSTVHTSQNMISNIESGQVGSSTFIMPICRTLRIPPPSWYEDEDDRAWAETGRILRARDMEVFRRALSMVEAMVAALPSGGNTLTSDEEH